MSNFRTGDVVARKSYGQDMDFMVSDVMRKEDGRDMCILRGLLYRIEADADEDDLVKQNPYRAYMNTRMAMTSARKQVLRSRSADGDFRTRRGGKLGRILHIDSSSEFLKNCLSYYREANIEAVGRVVSESEQPGVVKRLLQRYRPDVLVVTGHDGIKKESENLGTLDGYRNSRYYVESVKRAREYEPSEDKLCIFAGACQSYFEAIMEAGANFASAPGRILIHYLDPSIVAEKVCLTPDTSFVRPEDVVPLTKSGSKGIGGVRTKGQRAGW